MADIEKLGKWSYSEVFEARAVSLSRLFYSSFA
jgi:hypothetical protein